MRQRLTLYLPKKLIAIALAAIVGASIAGNAQAWRRGNNWRTPSGNIVCHGKETVLGGTLMCYVGSAQTRFNLTNGFRVGIVRGASPLYGWNVLGYGHRWTWGWAHIICNSHKAALTCRSADGHGMRLSRESQQTW